MTTPSAAIPDDFAQWRRSIEQRLRDVSTQASTVVFAASGGGSLDDIADELTPRVGETVLTGGSTIVLNESVTNGTLVFLSRRVAGGTVGSMTYTRQPGDSFTITSSSATDASTVSWLLIEP